MKEKNIKIMTNNKAAKIITKEINSRAKLNRADSYLKEKNEIDKINDYSRNQLEIIFKKIVGFKNNINFFDKNKSPTLDLNKYTEDELKKKIQIFTKHIRNINNYIYLKFQKKKKMMVVLVAIRKEKLQQEIELIKIGSILFKKINGTMLCCM